MDRRPATTRQISYIKRLRQDNGTIRLEGSSYDYSENVELIAKLAATKRITVTWNDIWDWMEELADAHNHAMRRNLDSLAIDLTIDEASALIEELSGSWPLPFSHNLDEHIDITGEEILHGLTAWMDARAAKINAKYSDGTSAEDEKYILETPYPFTVTSEKLDEKVEAGARRYNYLRASHLQHLSELCETPEEETRVVGDMQKWGHQIDEGESFVVSNIVELAAREAMMVCSEQTANDTVRAMIRRSVIRHKAASIREAQRQVEKYRDGLK